MKKLLCMLMCFAMGCLDSEQLQVIASLEGDEDFGEELFLSYCAGCHGADGTGDRGPSLL